MDAHEWSDSTKPHHLTLAPDTSRWDRLAVSVEYAETANPPPSPSEFAHIRVRYLLRPLADFESPRGDFKATPNGPGPASQRPPGRMAGP